MVLNVDKIKEMIVYFADHGLGAHPSALVVLTWKGWITSSSFEHRSLMTYTGQKHHHHEVVVERMLTFCMSKWYSSYSAADTVAAQRVVRWVKRHWSLLCRDSYKASTGKGNILMGPSHPLHKLFEQLPSGKRYQGIRVITSRPPKRLDCWTVVRQLNCCSGMWAFSSTSAPHI